MPIGLQTLNYLDNEEIDGLGSCFIQDEGQFLNDAKVCLHSQNWSRLARWNTNTDIKCLFLPPFINGHKKTHYNAYWKVDIFLWVWKVDIFLWVFHNLDKLSDGFKNVSAGFQQYVHCTRLKELMLYVFLLNRLWRNTKSVFESNIQRDKWIHEFELG